MGVYGQMRVEGRPTVRQVYALAAALCARVGEPFPERRDLASDLIERVRLEIGHPRPALAETPRRRRSRRRPTP